MLMLHPRFLGILSALTIISAAAAQPMKAELTRPGPGPGTVTPASDKLPDGVRLRLGSNLFREPNYVNAASLSPDGKLLAVCGGSQMIRFLDVSTGKEVRRINIREY